MSTDNDLRLNRVVPSVEAPADFDRSTTPVSTVSFDASASTGYRAFLQRVFTPVKGLKDYLLGKTDATELAGSSPVPEEAVPPTPSTHHGAAAAPTLVAAAAPSLAARVGGSESTHTFVDFGSKEPSGTLAQMDLSAFLARQLLENTTSFGEQGS